MNETAIKTELAQIEAAIAGQEASRGLLPAAQIEAALSQLQQKKAALEAQLPRSTPAGGGLNLAGAKVGGSVNTGYISAGGDVAGRDNITLTGDFSGSVVNVASRLTHAQATVNALPHAADSVKTELTDLLAELKQALAQLPAPKQEEAEAVATAAADLIEKAATPQPNRTSIQISGEGLKQAAQNLAAVMPTVVTIAAQIVTAVSRALPV
jgi:hypothetical protein